MKKSLIPLPILFALLLPGFASANPAQFVADAPTGKSAGTAARPVYLRQLTVLQEKTHKQSAPPALEHRVSRGETLGAIARKYGTSVEYLMGINNLRNPHYIREGQVLTLLVEEPVQDAFLAGATHTLRRGETIWDLARAYKVSMETILAANDIADPHRLTPGRTLFIPNGEAAAVAVVQPRQETVVASRSVARSEGFIWPTSGYISSGYGPRWGSFHYGIDIAAVTGTPIVAAAGGTVIDAGWRRGYGYMVRIDHKNGWSSVYGHASRLFVKAGQDVRSGEKIAAVGQTGNATGPHLHLELIYNDKHQNPLKHLPSR